MVCKIKHNASCTDPHCGGCHEHCSHNNVKVHLKVRFKTDSPFEMDSTLPITYNLEACYPKVMFLTIEEIKD